MALSSKILHSQLSVLKPIISTCSIELARSGQDKLGELMRHGNRHDVEIEKRSFENFEAAWVTPYGEPRNGVILYLHGGGYVCGGLEYALGFGSVLAKQFQIPVFAPAYRLAPENRYPAAIEDALEAYTYLTDSGYSADKIILCGESAGGGLIYSLCLKLREMNMPMPCGIIAISPWTDLTSSGNSYDENRDIDPSMTKERLKLFADSYVDEEQKRDPLVSPLFADLSSLPPSIIFVGGDEIMLDDAVLMHRSLIEHGCRSSLHVAPGLWHGYLLYNVKECGADFERINDFLRSVLPYERKLHWMPLDNSAKIYPASRSRNWNNLFRLSATMCEDIDKKILQSSLDVTVRRFPSISVRLRRGAFWYYLEEIPAAPEISSEASYPLVKMSERQLKSCAFRVIAYKNRIAVEFFHALTDGNGGMIFLKTLVAEYVKQKYHVNIPCECGILDRLEPPKPEELEDSFLRSDGDISKSRSDTNAYKFKGTPEDDGFLNLTTFTTDASEILKLAHDRNVTLTTLLSSAMIYALIKIQNKHCKNRKRQKPVKILIPVNLRPLFNSTTLRNFVLYITPGVDPKMGRWEFDEICNTIHHMMNLQTTKKEMATRITANVKSERSPILKVMPLFIKNFAMKAVFNAVGEKKSCLTLSNIGKITLPSELSPYVLDMDFIIGRQANLPHACAVLSYNGKLKISITRSVKESELELEFFKVLRSLGASLTVESNQRYVKQGGI